MYRKMLRSKIHRARVTDSNLEYEGSITIAKDLLERAGMLEYELVQVVNLNNGARFETYTISGEEGSGVVELNGAAARLAQIGDQVIIMSYGLVAGEDLENWKPIRVLVDEKNQVREVLC